MEYEILQALKRIENILNKIEERQKDMEDELKFIKESYKTDHDSKEPPTPNCHVCFNYHYGSCSECECGSKFVPIDANCNNCKYSTASGYEEPCNSCENYSNWKKKKEY